MQHKKNNDEDIKKRTKCPFLHHIHQLQNTASAVLILQPPRGHKLEAMTCLLKKIDRPGTEKKKGQNNNNSDVVFYYNKRRICEMIRMHT